MNATNYRLSKNMRGLQFYFVYHTKLQIIGHPNNCTGRLHIDMLLKKGDGRVIIELKRPSTYYNRRVREAMEQIKHYLID